MSQLWTQILAVVGPAISAILVAIFAWHTNHKTAKAQEKASDAARRTAEAAINDTFTKAAQQQDEHWARYTEAQQRDNEYLRKQISDNATRLEQAEMRAEADKVARTKAEHLYSVAIIYLRRVIRWIDQNLPGEDYPAPPPELNLDL